MMDLRIVPDATADGAFAALPPGATLAEAAAAVVAAPAGCLADVDDAGRLRGLLTAADIVRAVAGAGAAALRRPAAGLARPPSDFLAPGDRIVDALDLLAVRAAPALPVVADGRLIAVVGALDLALAVRRGLAASHGARHAALFGAVGDGEQPR